MQISRALVSLSLLLSAAASPLSRRVIAKRATPMVSGLTQDLSMPFSDAVELMKAGVEGNEDVFPKYFNDDDRDTVVSVFDKLLGGTNGEGADELGGITVGPGADGNPNERSYMELFDTDNPFIGLFDDVFGYANSDTYDCDHFEETGLSDDMFLQGSIILHEYSHWDKFLSPLHGGMVTDPAYGVDAARAIDKSQALFNADSYAWYATESYWANKCGKDGGYEYCDSDDDECDD